MLAITIRDQVTDGSTSERRLCICEDAQRGRSEISVRAGTVVAADLVNFPAAGPTWSVAGGVFYCTVLLNTLVCFGGGVAYRTVRYQSDLVDEKRICLLSCRKDTKTSDAVSRWKDSA